MYRNILKGNTMKSDAFRILIAAALLIVVVSGCEPRKEHGKEAVAQSAGERPDPKNTPPPAHQDVSTATLAGIDPGIQAFADAVEKARSSYDKKSSPAAKAALVDTYVKFGDYMQYESPVSPRKGKYRRALMEYRHALQLDPQNSKVQKEIQQIEEIYRSMNRPIPTEDEG
jgi:hypothetical protein